MLSAPYASPSAERACAELFEATSSRQAADRCYYPRCLGTVRVDDRQIWESGIHEFVSDGVGKGDVGTRRRKRASALDEPPSICRGFLLEYIEGIREITREMVTPSLAAELKVALATIHALNVRHNDFENHASWPEVRFGNLFVRPTGEPVILDFNRSTVLSDSAKDQALLKEEADKLSEMLEVALGKMDPWEGIPKETRRLLADSRDFRGRNG